jgi:hypothetical protein
VQKEGNIYKIGTVEQLIDTNSLPIIITAADLLPNNTFPLETLESFMDVDCS